MPKEVLEKSLTALKDQALRLEDEKKAAEEQVRIKNKQISEVLVRIEEFETAIKKLDKENASKSKKTK